MRSNRTGLTWVALFASVGTLLCCAMPIVLVAFGLGATVAAISSSAPLLVTLTANKIWVFAASAVLLGILAWTLYRLDRNCPSDRELQAACNRANQWSRHMLWFAVTIWVIGFVAAYLALPVRIWLDT